MKRLIIAILIAALLLMMPRLHPQSRPGTIAKDQARIDAEITISILEQQQ